MSLDAYEIHHLVKAHDTQRNFIVFHWLMMKYVI